MLNLHLLDIPVMHTFVQMTYYYKARHGLSWTNRFAFIILRLHVTV